MAHDLPRQTRSFIALRRYVQFVQSLLDSDNPVINQLASLCVSSVRSVTGRNVHNMREEFGLDPAQANKRDFEVPKTKIPENGQETIELLDFLLYIRNQETEEEILDELNDLIAVVASN